MSDPSNPRYGEIDRDYAARLASTAPADDGPIWMVNLMSYREVAEYADGRTTTLSGREADDLYAPLDHLAGVGAEPVFVADVDQQLLGHEPPWHRVGVVRYPTRSAFVQMSQRPGFAERHEHKDAGMAQSIVAGCEPIPSPQDGGDAPALVDWSEVPRPPTADDGPVTVLHLIRFHPGQADDEMVRYQNDAAKVAVPHGVRISGWFAVEGTIIGDGRAWDQARFNQFPSKAAFMAVVLDPGRLEAQHQHRETAIADTYTMILRPTIDRLAASTAT
jgi:hypothetical protein